MLIVDSSSIDSVVKHKLSKFVVPYMMVEHKYQNVDMIDQ